MEKKKYKLKGFSDIFCRKKINEPLRKIISFLKIAEKSSKKNRLNYFFQMINLFLAVGLLWIVIPNLVDPFLTRWKDIEIFYSYVTKYGLVIFLNFVAWAFSLVFNFSWSSFLQTSTKLTIQIFICLFLFLSLIYYKFIITLYIKIKNDLNYLFYEWKK